MINDIIRALREYHDLKQEDIAKVLQTNQKKISRMENGTQKINSDEIIALCTYYHISADYLLELPRNLPYPVRKKKNPIG